MRLAICLFLVGLTYNPIHAQETKPQDILQNLQAQQQQIISQLNDIRQLLAAVMRPPQPSEPPSALATKDELFRGASDASVAIIEYADFECPFCGQYEYEVYPRISKDYIQTGKVKYFYRDMPLPEHPHAMIAARAARCAGEQGKFWEMHDSLFAKQNLLRDVDMPGRAADLGLDAGKFSECLSSDRYTDEVKRSANEAEKLGIDGTPSFFVGIASPDGTVTNLKMILGMRPYDAFKSAIEDTLAAKK
jgi:protein-disulfide isomerase